MLPKAVEPKLPLGCAKAGVLVRLKTSPRNSACASPGRWMCFTRAMSRLRLAGPRTGLREALLMVNFGAGAKASVLKKWAGVRSPDESDVFATMLGRCKAKPAKELLLVACVTVTGMPDCSEAMALNVQPPRSVFAMPVEAKLWPRPAGRS